MTYPAHYLMQFGGPAYSGSERWSCNIRWILEPEELIDVDQQETAEELLTYMASRFSNDVLSSTTPGFGIGGSASLQYVKFNAIGPDGKYLDPNASYGAYQAAQQGYVGSSSPAYPPQVALAVSWETDLTRGPASKGRIFLPSPQAPVTSAAGIATGTLTAAVALAWAKHLNAMQDAISDGLSETKFYPAVVSAVGAGRSARIERVRVGNVLDTQRRRRNELIEAYSESTVPY